MKIIFTLLFTVSIALASFAQPTTDEFPDFTVTDIEGNTHNLYQLLDQGQIVIVDVFATWCGNCIASLPALEEIWNLHGPDGDNTIFMISFERDPNTSNEAAFASNYNVENPIVADEVALIESWNITYQPRFFVICQDKTWTLVTGNIGTNSTALLGPAADCESNTDIPQVDEGLILRLNSTIFNEELSFETSESIVDFRLINLNGVVVHSGIASGKQTLNTVDLAQGMYLIQLQQDDQVVTKRVIKE
jgi:peroxiredoxin